MPLGKRKFQKLSDCIQQWDGWEWFKADEFLFYPHSSKALTCLSVQFLSFYVLLCADKMVIHHWWSRGNLLASCRFKIMLVFHSRGWKMNVLWTDKMYNLSGSCRIYVISRTQWLRKQRNKKSNDYLVGKKGKTMGEEDRLRNWRIYAFINVHLDWIWLLVMSYLSRLYLIKLWEFMGVFFQLCNTEEIRNHF